MKTILWVLIVSLILTLSGCDRSQPEETAAVVQTIPEMPSEVPEQTPPMEETQAAETEEVLPELNVPTPPPEAPALPEAAYCFGDTAFHADGTPIFQVEGYTLSPLRDCYTGELTAILATPAEVTAPAVLYDLQGWVLRKELPHNIHCRGDLLWYQNLTSCTLLQISSGEILYGDLRSIWTVGAYLCLEPTFWNDPIRLMDASGRLVTELENGFSCVDSAVWQGEPYLIVQARDGTQTVADINGNGLLGRFYEEVSSISMGCAVIRDGVRYKALSLEAGETVFQWERPFTLLSGCALVEINDDGHCRLVDLQGQSLSQEIYDLSYAFIPEGGEQPAYVLGRTTKDAQYHTQILAADGTQLGEIPVDLWNVTPLSSNWLQYYRNQFQTLGHVQTGYLLDLTTGETRELGQAGAFRSAVLEEDRLLIQRRDADGIWTWQLTQYDGGLLAEGNGPCFYPGGWILSTEQGLIDLDGNWLYQPQ